MSSVPPTEIGRPKVKLSFCWQQKKPFLILSVLSGLICLSIYTTALWHLWQPEFKNQNFLSAKVSQPIAQDFPLHWVASLLTLSGEPGAVYNFDYLRSKEERLTGSGPLRWPYPPSALLIDLPLALFPYKISLVLWLSTTLLLYLLVLYYIAPNPFTIYFALAFFGTFANFCQGQNGFLSAALMGSGLLLLETYPVLGGMLLGLLSYKPHIAALIPLALIFCRQWRAFAGTMISGLSLILTSALFFGVELWRSFFQNISCTFNSLQTDTSLFAKIPSIYAACRLAGYPQTFSWLFQSLAMLLALYIIVIIWRKTTSLALRATSLVLATLLFSPYIWYYDLTLLALALAWLWQDGLSYGLFPGESSLLFWSYASPLLTFFLSVDLKMPCGFLYLLLPFVLLQKKYRQQSYSNDHF